VNALHFTEWRRSLRAFEQMAMIGEITLNLTGAGEPERLVAARVSPSLFPMLGARIDPEIAGHKIVLDGRPYEVTGVLSSSFHFPKLSLLYAMTVNAERPEVWKPFAVKQAFCSRSVSDAQEPPRRLWRVIKVREDEPSNLAANAENEYLRLLDRCHASTPFCIHKNRGRM
jgi:hypothetical protein